MNKFIRLVTGFALICSIRTFQAATLTVFNHIGSDIRVRVARLKYGDSIETADIPAGQSRYFDTFVLQPTSLAWMDISGQKAYYLPINMSGFSILGQYHLYPNGRYEFKWPLGADASFQYEGSGTGEKFSSF
jgi:hypothetical protein